MNLLQATNIDYDEHKGRIAIGRLHAGVLQKGMEVRVSLILFWSLVCTSFCLTCIYMELSIILTIQMKER